MLQRTIQRNIPYLNQTKTYHTSTIPYQNIQFQSIPCLCNTKTCFIKLLKIQSRPCYSGYIPCTILTPDVKREMIQKTIEKKRNQPGGYIGGEKMEMVNGTARWIQLVSYSLKSLQVLLWLRLFSSEGVWARPVRMRVSVSDSCESRYSM